MKFEKTAEDHTYRVLHPHFGFIGTVTRFEESTGRGYRKMWMSTYPDGGDAETGVKTRKEAAQSLLVGWPARKRWLAEKAQ